MKAPQNDHNDPRDDPRIKIENATDEAGNATEEDENEELEESSMESEKNEHKDNEDKDTEHNNNTCETHTNNEPEHNANEISNTIDDKYGKRSRANMRARKRKYDLPPKMCIHPTINSEMKRSKI